MTNRQRKLEVIADTLQYWLDRNESGLQKDGIPVTPDSDVIPTAWPSRKVLENWIKVLIDEDSAPFEDYSEARIKEWMLGHGFNPDGINDAGSLLEALVAEVQQESMTR